jgi:hypothetical protein
MIIAQKAATMRTITKIVPNIGRTPNNAVSISALVA